MYEWKDKLPSIREHIYGVGKHIMCLHCFRIFGEHPIPMAVELLDVE